MDANNLDAGLPIEDYWVIHYNEDIKYLTDDKIDARIAFKCYSENQDLPFKMTRLKDFGSWSKQLAYNE